MCVMKKKSISIVAIVLCLCMVSVPALAAEPFRDVPGHWGEEAILWAYRNGLVGGVSAERFAPNAKMTRAQFITLVYRMVGEPEAAETEPFFRDVPKMAFSFRAVQWAEENNLMHGCGEGQFGPDGFITREEIAVVLHQYLFYEYRLQHPDGPHFSLNYPDYPEQYTDTAAISESADRAMRWAVGNFKILSGKTPTTLNPKDTATRAEAVTFLQRFRGM